MKKEDILSLTPEEINRMNKEELLMYAKVIQKSLRDARRRLRKLAGETGIEAPALKIYEKGTISAQKKMNAGELKREVTKGIVMMKYKTGTVTEARNVEAALRSAVGERVGGELSTQESKNMWKIIDRLAEVKPGLLGVTDPDYIPAHAQMIAFSFIKQKKENGIDYKSELTDEEMEQAVYEAEKFFKSKYEGYEIEEEDLYGFNQ